MKNKTIKSFMALVVMVMAFAVTGITAKAATVTNLQQKSASTTSVNIEWTGVAGAKYYGIQAATDKAFTNIVYKNYTYSSTSSYYISSLATGGTYYVRIGYGADSNSCYANFSAPLEVVTKPASMGDISFVGADNTTATIQWAPVAGANLYVVKYGDLMWSTTTTSFKVPIGDGTWNTTYVIPCRQAATGYIGEGSYSYISKITKLTTKVSKSNFGLTNVYSSWNECDFGVVANGNGWEIQGQTVSGKKYTFKGSANSTTSRIEIKNKIKTSKMYKYRVRAYIITTAGKKVYGSWSDYRYIVRPSLKYTQARGKIIKLNWKKMSGVSKIKIQISTKEKSGYKTCATLKGSKTSYTIKKCGKTKLKKGKRYYVKVIYYNSKGKSADIISTVNTKIYY